MRKAREKSDKTINRDPNSAEPAAVGCEDGT